LTPAATPTPPLEDAAPRLIDPTQARINHLFRAARRQGQIHPLQHLIERYRAGQAAADPSVKPR
jgi:hypothetical protein